MIAPPTQSHITSVPTCTPSVTGPARRSTVRGADTSVRYTSCHGSVCTLGVPMPSGKSGYDEIAGE